MRIVGLLREHLFLSLVGACVVGAGITGTVYWLSRPKPATFVAAKEFEPLPPLPEVKLPPAPPKDAPLDELAKWIRPHENEYRWLAIPWQKSILKAQEIARQTGRLIFLWGTNQPVGRC